MCREAAAFKTEINHLAQNEEDSIKNGRLSRAVSAENNRQWGRGQAPFAFRHRRFIGRILQPPSWADVYVFPVHQNNNNTRGFIRRECTLKVALCSA